MHIVKQVILRKKLEEYDGIPNNNHSEKQYGQIFPLDVYFFVTNNTVCMELKCATTRAAIHNYN